MKEKRYQKICDTMAPKMRPGEYVVAAAFGNIGHVSMGKQFAMGVATAIATGGLLSVHKKPRPTYVVATNYRLVFLEPGVWGGPSKQFNGFVAYNTIVGMTEPKRGIQTIFQIMIHGRDKALRIQFPRPARADGEQIIQMLRVPVYR